MRATKARRHSLNILTALPSLFICYVLLAIIVCVMSSFSMRLMFVVVIVWLGVIAGFETSRNLKKPATILSLGKKLEPPIGFVSPNPKPFVVADGNYGGFLKGAAALASRFGSGAFVVGWTPITPDKQKGAWPGTLNLLRDSSTILPFCARPAKPLILYEFEASPFCRKVREAMSMLDLTVEYRPCPGAREGWSDVMARSTHGKRTVPYLIDSNANIAMFESDDIIKYLFNTYGPGEDYIPWTLKGRLAVDTATISSFIRGNAG